MGFNVSLQIFLGFWGEVFISEPSEEDKIKEIFSYNKIYFFIIFILFFKPIEKLTFLYSCIFLGHMRMCLSVHKL